MNTRPPAAAALVTSTFLWVCPTREPSSAYVDEVSTAAGPATKRPPLDCAIAFGALEAQTTNQSLKLSSELEMMYWDKVAQLQKLAY